MGPADIEIDGYIDLIDHQGTDRQADVDRARQSRLADVMIVLERDRAALEEALRVRLASTVMHGIDSLTLELDAAAPKFHVTIHSSPVGDGVAGNIMADQWTLLENAVAEEVGALIEQRASHSPNPRWQPVVTAECRNTVPATVAASIPPGNVIAPPDAPESTTASARVPAGEAAHQSRLKSIWLHILFWLLALVIMGTAALYWTTGIE